MSRQQRKRWQPLEMGPPDRAYMARREQAMRDAGIDPDTQEPLLAVAINDTYQVVVTRAASGLRHLSIHRHDRKAMRDWRHLQQIKSEVLGPASFAVEMFPPDDLVFDTSNEYHLWELPPDTLDTYVVPDAKRVYDAADVNAARVRGESKARQRPMQPGLTAFDQEEWEPSEFGIGLGEIDGGGE